MTNIIKFPDRKPAPPPDPWEHAQPTLREMGDREELWSHPYFGIPHMIWATGRNNVPEPPSPSGGSPFANRSQGYERLRAVA